MPSSKKWLIIYRPNKGKYFLKLVLKTHEGLCSPVDITNGSFLILKRVVNNCGKNPI